MTRFSGFIELSWSKHTIFGKAYIVAIALLCSFVGVILLTYLPFSTRYATAQKASVALDFLRFVFGTGAFMCVGFLGLCEVMGKGWTANLRNERDM